MRRSLLFSLVAGFSGGLILAEYLVLTTSFSSGGLVIGAILFWWKRGRLLGVLVVGLTLGLIRWQVWMAPVPDGLEPYLHHHVRLAGVVMEQTDFPPSSQLVLRDIAIADQVRTGGIEVWLDDHPPPVGSRITFECRLEEFQQDRRIQQQSHGVRARCQDPSTMTVTAAKRHWRVRLALLRQGMIDRIQGRFLQPQSAFLTGILLGDTAGMPSDVVESFRRTGTSHLVALSGFNVSIMIAAVNAVLIRGLGRRWAWLPSLVGVAVFVVMTGASASVTRAATMSIIVLLAGVSGRPILPARLLSYTLLVMTWHNPAILRHDLGFQLSFLATAGLLYLSKPLESWLSWIPEAVSARSSLATTMAAMLMTEPLLIWTFGRVAPIGILVNLLVLPLMPLAMAAGSAALLVPPAQPLADVLLRLILGVITWGSTTPAAAVVPPKLMAGLIAAGCVVSITILVRHARHQDPLR